MTCHPRQKPFGTWALDIIRLSSPSITIFRHFQEDPRKAGYTLRMRLLSLAARRNTLRFQIRGAGNMEESRCKHKITASLASS